MFDRAVLVSHYFQRGAAVRKLKQLKRAFKLVRFRLLEACFFAQWVKPVGVSKCQLVQLLGLNREYRTHRSSSLTEANRRSVFRWKRVIKFEDVGIEHACEYRRRRQFVMNITGRSSNTRVKANAQKQALEIGDLLTGLECARASLVENTNIDATTRRGLEQSLSHTEAILRPLFVGDQ